MKNKRRLKALLLAAIAAVGTLLLSSCSSKEVYTGRRKVFKTGEHTITYLVKTGDSFNTQFNCPEGYEVLSMGVTSGNNFVYLLKNTTNVECAETDKGYTQVGTPAEKVLKLTQEE